MVPIWSLAQPVMMLRTCFLELLQDILHYFKLLWCFLFSDFVLIPFIICILDGFWFLYSVTFVSSYFAEIVNKIWIFHSVILWSLIYTILPYVDINTFHSFTIFIILISYSCLFDLAAMSSTILNRYRESEQLCLVPDFTGIALMLACQFIMVTNGRGRKIIIFGGNMLLLGCFCSSAWTHIHAYKRSTIWT